MWMIQKLFTNIIKIVFPTYCFVCKKEGEALCHSCLRALSKSYDSPFPWIESLYSFKDIRVKKIIHAIKYFHRKDLIYPLADTLATIVKDEKYTGCLLLPIPMPRLRKYIRGYNHNEALVKCLSQKTNLSYSNTILIKGTNTKRQVKTTSRSERLRNQKNSFSLIGSVQGNSFILLDDVTTTGATLMEARKELLKHGAKNVWAITIAH